MSTSGVIVKKKTKNLSKTVHIKFNSEQIWELEQRAESQTKGNLSKLIRGILFETGRLKNEKKIFSGIDFSNAGSNDRLEKDVKVRFTLRQYDYLSLISLQATNGDLSKLIRLLCLNKKVEIVSKVDIETRNQLRKIGVNINQIAKVINAINNKGEYEKALNKLDLFLNEVKETIKKIH